MKKLRPLFLLILSAAVTHNGLAQSDQRQAFKDLLTANGVAVTELDAERSEGGVQEIRVRWQAYAETSSRMLRAATAPRPGANFSILSRRQWPGTLLIHRAPELSPEQVLVVAVDAQARMRGWTLIADPRIVRYESESPTGELSGQILYRATPEFMVALPDDAAITEIRLYHPRWTGERFVLDALGKISLQ